MEIKNPYCNPDYAYTESDYWRLPVLRMEDVYSCEKYQEWLIGVKVLRDEYWARKMRKDAVTDGDGGDSGSDSIDTGGGNDSGGGGWGDAWENEPRIPAGVPGAGEWTSEGVGDTNTTSDPQTPSYEDAQVPGSWSNQDLDAFADKFNRHADDFGAKTWDDYANQANQFFQKFQNDGLPAIEYPNGGEIGVYEPSTNTFGVYTSDGLTKTFYKPTSPTYFEREIQDVISRGGSIIDSLPVEPIGGGGGSASPMAGKVPRSNDPTNLLD